MVNTGDYWLRMVDDNDGWLLGGECWPEMVAMVYGSLESMIVMTVIITITITIMTIIVLITN